MLSAKYWQDRLSLKMSTASSHLTQPFQSQILLRLFNIEEPFWLGSTGSENYWPIGWLEAATSTMDPID